MVTLLRIEESSSDDDGGPGEEARAGAEGRTDRRNEGDYGSTSNNTTNGSDGEVPVAQRKRPPEELWREATTGAGRQPARTNGESQSLGREGGPESVTVQLQVSPVRYGASRAGTENGEHRPPQERQQNRELLARVDDLLAVYQPPQPPQQTQAVQLSPIHLPRPKSFTGLLRHNTGGNYGPQPQRQARADDGSYAAHRAKRTVWAQKRTAKRKERAAETAAAQPLLDESIAFAERERKANEACRQAHWQRLRERRSERMERQGTAVAAQGQQRRLADQQTEVRERTAPLPMERDAALTRHQQRPVEQTAERERERRRKRDEERRRQANNSASRGNFGRGTQHANGRPRVGKQFCITRAASGGKQVSVTRATGHRHGGSAGGSDRSTDGHVTSDEAAEDDHGSPTGAAQGVIESENATAPSDEAAIDSRRSNDANYWPTDPDHEAFKEAARDACRAIESEKASASGNQPSSEPRALRELRENFRREDSKGEGGVAEPISDGPPNEPERASVDRTRPDRGKELAATVREGRSPGRDYRLRDVQAKMREERRAEARSRGIVIHAADERRREDPGDAPAMTREERRADARGRGPLVHVAGERRREDPGEASGTPTSGEEGNGGEGNRNVNENGAADLSEMWGQVQAHERRRIENDGLDEGTGGGGSAEGAADAGDPDTTNAADDTASPARAPAFQPAVARNADGQRLTEGWSESRIDATTSLPQLMGMRHRLKMLLERVEGRIEDELVKRAIEEHAPGGHIVDGGDRGETGACCPLCLSTAGSADELGVAACDVCDQLNCCKFCGAVCQTCERACCMNCATVCTGCGDGALCGDCGNTAGLCRRCADGAPGPEEGTRRRPVDASGASSTNRPRKRRKLSDGRAMQVAQQAPPRRPQEGNDERATTGAAGRPHRPAPAGPNRDDAANGEGRPVAAAHYALAVPPGTTVVRSPQSHDVLSGRGSVQNNHPWNLLYRQIVDSFKGAYRSATSLEKADVAARVVGTVRGLSPPGRFLKEEGPNSWVEIGDGAAHAKAMQALRDASREDGGGADRHPHNVAPTAAAPQPDPAAPTPMYYNTRYPVVAAVATAYPPLLAQALPPPPAPVHQPQLPPGPMHQPTLPPPDPIMYHPPLPPAPAHYSLPNQAAAVAPLAPPTMNGAVDPNLMHNARRNAPRATGNHLTTMATAVAPSIVRRVAPAAPAMRAPAPNVMVAAAVPDPLQNAALQPPGPVFDQPKRQIGPVPAIPTNNTPTLTTAPTAHAANPAVPEQLNVHPPPNHARHRFTLFGYKDPGFRICQDEHDPAITRICNIQHNSWAYWNGLHAGDILIPPDLHSATQSFAVKPSHDVTSEWFQRKLQKRPLSFHTFRRFESDNAINQIVKRMCPTFAELQQINYSIHRCVVREDNGQEVGFTFSTKKFGSMTLTLIAKVKPKSPADVKYGLKAYDVVCRLTPMEGRTPENVYDWFSSKMQPKADNSIGTILFDVVRIRKIHPGEISLFEELAQQEGASERLQRNANQSTTNGSISEHINDAQQPPPIVRLAAPATPALREPAGQVLDHQHQTWPTPPIPTNNTATLTTAPTTHAANPAVPEQLNVPPPPNHARHWFILFGNNDPGFSICQDKNDPAVTRICSIQHNSWAYHHGLHAGDILIPPVLRSATQSLAIQPSHTVTSEWLERKKQKRPLSFHVFRPRESDDYVNYIVKKVCTSQLQKINYSIHRVFLRECNGQKMGFTFARKDFGSTNLTIISQVEPNSLADVKYGLKRNDIICRLTAEGRKLEDMYDWFSYKMQPKADNSIGPILFDAVRIGVIRPGEISLFEELAQKERASERLQHEANQPTTNGSIPECTNDAQQSVNANGSLVDERRLANSNRPQPGPNLVLQNEVVDLTGPDAEEEQPVQMSERPRVEEMEAQNELTVQQQREQHQVSPHGDTQSIPEVEDQSRSTEEQPAQPEPIGDSQMGTQQEPQMGARPDDVADSSPNEQQQSPSVEHRSESPVEPEHSTVEQELQHLSEQIDEDATEEPVPQLAGEQHQTVAPRESNRDEEQPRIADTSEQAGDDAARQHQPETTEHASERTTGHPATGLGDTHPSSHSHIYEIGTEVSKMFVDDQGIMRPFAGEIESYEYDADEMLYSYMIRYEDGDAEEMCVEDLEEILVHKQRKGGHRKSKGVVLTGTLSYSEEDGKRRHIIEGEWSNRGSSPQHFHLVRKLSSDEDVRVLPMSGVFEGLFVHEYDVGMLKLKMRDLVRETNVKVSFIEKETEGKFTIKGKGTNRFGQFKLNGTATKRADDPSYDVRMKKKYLPSATPTETGIVSENSVNSGGLQAGGLPAPSKLYPTGVITLRGQIAYSHDIGNGTFNQRITGLWAPSLEALLVDPENVHGIFNAFQYDLKEPRGSPSDSGRPLSGKFAGSFDMDGKTIYEPEISIHFRKNSEGFYNIEGEGRNEFGSYKISGTLQDEVVTIFHILATA